MVRTLTQVFAAVFALALAAAAAPAAEEKVLNLYIWSDYLAPATLANFTKKTGIKVNMDVFDSSEALEGKLLAGASGYDVIVPNGPLLNRFIKAGVVRPLDKAKLPQIKTQDPNIIGRAAAQDPGNAHAIVYMWGTTGIGYNVAEIKKRMPDAPVDSLRMIFDPAVVSKFKDCGVMMLDSATDVLPAALRYLGLDPDSKKTEDLARAADVVKAVRPFIRKFHSSEYINALAGGNICLAFGFSGDVFQARDRAAKARDRQEIAYAVPREGSLLWIDVAAIPKDAPNPANALRFLDLLMEPRVAAASSELTGYANGNKAAFTLLPKEISGNPLIYPPADVRAKFYTITAGTPDQTRERTRLWTTVKTGR